MRFRRAVLLRVLAGALDERADILASADRACRNRLVRAEGLGKGQRRKQKSAERQQEAGSGANHGASIAETAGAYGR